MMNVCVSYSVMMMMKKNGRDDKGETEHRNEGQQCCEIKVVSEEKDEGRNATEK